jgi:hypothetical protein
MVPSRPISTNQASVDGAGGIQAQAPSGATSSVAKPFCSSTMVAIGSRPARHFRLTIETA